MSTNIRYLPQEEAQRIDEELFSEYAFSVDQLMELAGLSCAVAIQAGYKPTIYYPTAPKKQLYKNLVTQCEKMGVAFLAYMPSDVKILESSYGVVVDALFGFGFRPPLKPEFAEVVQQIANLQTPLVCIDVPSGWEIGEKTENEDILQPDCLISLTAPKLCAHRFNGRFHFLGGRFIPQMLADKYNLNLPPYPDSSPIVLLSGPQQPTASK